jgi:hypothetical protein
MFSEDQLGQLRSFPEVSRDELIRYFTPMAGHVAFVDPGRGRGAPDRLGMLVQLCTLPWLGFVPDEVRSAPSAAVARLADRLGVDPAALSLYGQRGTMGGRGGRSMDPLTGVENAALVEGVKFLYQQAAEVLSAWRARPDPVGPDMADTLQELKDLVEPIKDGVVDLEAITGRQAVARLRDLLEVIVASPMTFAGEPPRTVDVSDIGVVVQRVTGQVRGVHADLAKVQGPAAIRVVRVHGADVDSSG